METFSRLSNDVTKGLRLSNQEFLARVERGWDVLSKHGETAKFGAVLDLSELMRSSLLPPKTQDPHHRCILSASLDTAPILSLSKGKWSEGTSVAPF